MNKEQALAKAKQLGIQVDYVPKHQSGPFAFEAQIDAEAPTGQHFSWNDEHELGLDAADYKSEAEMWDYFAGVLAEGLIDCPNDDRCGWWSAKRDNELWEAADRAWDERKLRQMEEDGI